MVNVAILKWQWTGFAGAPGLTQFAVDATTPAAADAANAAARDFFSAALNQCPATIKVDPLPDADVYDHETGALVDTYPLLGLTTVPGNSISAEYVGPAGGYINWSTGTIANGRRVSGRTFIVPMGTGSFQGSGLSTGAVASLDSAGAAILDYNALAADGRFVIWGRPFQPKAGDTRPARPASLGYITGFKVPDKIGVLRGRRDS